MTRPVQAAILCGGLGTRMRPFTDTMPKPMAPVNGKPFLGYLISQLREQGIERVVLLTGYHPVPDGHYLRSRKVGAMLGPEAIRTALGRALAERTGQLHVHLHEHDGEPIPSPTDSRELPPLAQSLGRAAPDQTSGYAILSNDAAWAELYPPPSHKPVVASRWTVIGFPLRFLR